MKKTRLLSNLSIVILLILFIALFLWLLRVNLTLRQIWNERKHEFQEAKTSIRRLETLEKQGQDLKQKEDTLYNKVSLDEKQPLSLIKSLISIGGEIGLRGVTISVEEKGEARTEQASGLPQTGPKPLYLKMNFEGTFTQLLDFLKKLNHLERIVTVSTLEIKRSEEILPYQKASLQLITYTFSQK